MDVDQESLEWTQPLSPVLSSSKSSKKFMKNSNSNKKSGTKLCEKFETEVCGHNEKKDDFLKSLTDDHFEEEMAKFDTSTKVKLLENSSKIVPSSFSFQTASGKELLLKGSSSEYANMLFGDLFDPSSLNIRENKYNFLSNKLSSVSTEKANSEDEEFLGFKEEECISSKQKLGNILELSNAISTSKCHWERALKKEPLIEFNIPKYNKKRKFQDCSKEEEFEIIQRKSLKMNVESNISQDNPVNNIHEIDIEDMKNPQESSQKEVVLSLRNELSGYQNHEVEGQIEQNEQFQLEVNHKFQNLHTLNNCYNYLTDNIQPIGEENAWAATTPEEKNTVALKVENTTNVFSALNEKWKHPGFENSDKYNYNSYSLAKYNNEQTNKSIPQFSTAAGKKISISSDAISKANSIILKDMQDLEVLQENTSLKNVNMPSAFVSHEKTGGNVNLQTFDGTTDLEIPEEHAPPNSASKSNNAIPYLPFSVIPQIHKTSGFSTASGKEIQIPSDSLAKMDHIFKDFTDLDDLTKNSISHGFSSSSKYMSPKVTDEKSCKMQEDDTSSLEMNKEIVTPVRDISKKKRLGTSFCRDGKFSDTAVNRVKSIFGDMNFDDLKLPGFLKIESPSYNSKGFPSTPITSGKIPSTPQFSTSYGSTPIRQVRRSVFNKNESFLNDFPPDHNCPLLIQKPTTGDLASWHDELKRQKIILEKKLSLISKKQEALSIQINTGLKYEENKPPPYHKKMNKISLKNVQTLEMQADCAENVNNVILQINPQNAILIHFNGKWFDDATVTTEDGCTLIPNQQGLIGLSEIEPAFCSMPYIKKTLIPNGWIRNHYKWIIWKLASYERFFPSTLGGCFTIDNVIKQLKYRYYRELYFAERPALRKIYEMDDISQKRMVLSISNIFKNGDNIELELTDGWYCIRTLIDELLCHQINKRKIRIGSKLIMSGAELVNCEGCYPLEMEQAQKVRLKINFNSTRRAAWFSKLGYQKNTMPLLIKIDDGNPAGGKIGAVKVYIMRTYPLIYREKTEYSVVWRNQNAENKKVQEYENEYFKEYEYVEQDSSSTKNVDAINKRQVCPIFQMTVIDVLSDKSKSYKCTIWDATDFHMHQLKENQITLIYNITLRSTDEICCNKQTRFEIPKENLIEYVKYRRKYVALADYDTISKNSNFGMFDTVGFVVKIHISEENQYFWLTNLSNSLLLVRINEGPSRCLLLNRIQEDQPVVVCNLMLKDDFQDYVMATAGLNTVVTNYPQYEFLRDELEKLKIVDKTASNILLKDAKMRVNNIQNDNSSKSTSFSSTGGNTLNFSRLTSTDIVMSMINIDDVVNNIK